MTTLNMMIGILTPPMGMALFVVARVGNMSVSTVTKGVLPFLIPIFLTLVLIRFSHKSSLLCQSIVCLNTKVRLKKSKAFITALFFIKINPIQLRFYE